MVNTYYTRNRYFDEVIRDYLENIHPEEWVKVDEPSESTTLVDMDFPHYRDGLMPTCKIMSQIAGLEVIGNKKNLYLTMKRHKPKSIGDYIPKTYLLDPSDTENLREIFDGRKFIVKPEDRECRKGIFVTKDYRDFCEKLKDKILKEKKEQLVKKRPPGDWIIQEYIENPLLYEGKKFHLRPYVFLIKRNGMLNVYVYNELQMYFAGDTYKEDNPASFLSEGGEEYEKRIFPKDFYKYYGPENISYIYAQIYKIVDDTTKPLSQVIPDSGGDAYKFIAYDILIDKEYKCHLAEVNHRYIGMNYHSQYFNPCLYKNLMNVFFFPIHTDKRVEFIGTHKLGKQNVKMTKTHSRKTRRRKTGSRKTRRRKTGRRGDRRKLPEKKC